MARSITLSLKSEMIRRVQTVARRKNQSVETHAEVTKRMELRDMNNKTATVKMLWHQEKHHKVK